MCGCVCVAILVFSVESQLAKALVVLPGSPLVNRRLTALPTHDALSHSKGLSEDKQEVTDRKWYSHRERGAS